MQGVAFILHITRSHAPAWEREQSSSFFFHHMRTSAIKFNEHAVDVSFTKTALHFVLADDREILAPLEWFPKLRDASEKSRKNWRFIGHGIGVHWPELDEDIAISTL